MRAVTALVWVLLCLPVPQVYAEIYKWVDEAGRIHFSDTLAGIPVEYRDRVEAKASRPSGLQSQPEPQPTTLVRPLLTAPPGPLSYSIPVRRDGSAMLVEAVIGGTIRARLLVDTGAEFTVLSTAAARRLGLDLGRAAVIPLRSASGVFLAPLTKVHSVSLGEAVAYNVEVIVHDAAPELDGLLGMSFLDNFSITISTSDERLILTTLVDHAEAGSYGGHPKDWWLRKFRFYRSQIESLHSYLALHALPELERTLRYMQTELEMLERQAMLAGVPRRWRD